MNSNPNPLVLLSVGHKAQESKVSSYFWLYLQTVGGCVCLALAIKPLSVYTVLKGSTRTEIANEELSIEWVLSQLKL